MSLMRSVASQIFQHARNMVHPPPNRKISHLTVHHESLEDLTYRYECFFCRSDIDGWDVRQAMNDLAGMDLVPDPSILIAALYACRRINDYALAVRFLESVKNKCVGDSNLYPYVLQEIAPTLSELGIDTPEALGYDLPELWVESSDEHCKD